MSRIYLSPPHLSGEESHCVSDVLASNWVAPAGPDLEAFEAEFCRATGARHALAVVFGTAALHLALRVAGVRPGDEVLVSSLTVAASAARVDARRQIFEWYAEHLAGIPGLALMPRASYGRVTRWLTVITIDPALCGATRDGVIDALELDNIESRPAWKPRHLQPACAAFDVVGGRVSEALFERGLCVPSGSALTRRDVERVADIVRACCQSAAGRRRAVVSTGVSTAASAGARADAAV